VAKPIVEWWVQRLSLFNTWDDFSCRTSLGQCLDKLRYLREAYPKRVWRVIERKTTETVHEDDKE